METYPRFWTVIFQNIFTLLAHQTKYLHMENQVLFSWTLSIWFLFPRNAKKSHTDQSIPLAFLLCLKRNVSQTLTSSSCKKIFPKCVYQLAICFNECFLFCVITGRHSFFIYKLTVTQKFGATAILLHSLKQVFWSYFLDVLNKIYFLIAIFHSFSLWMFQLNVPHFSL